MTTDMMQARVKALKLHGLLAHWEETRHESWVSQLLQWEEEERSQRSLDGRLKSARIGRFKPMANFDWDWPKKCDREAIEEFMQSSVYQRRYQYYSLRTKWCGQIYHRKKYCLSGNYPWSYRFIYYRRSHVK